MTAQIDDFFRYNGTDYSLAGISEGELFDISSLGLEPVWRSTACWRGYQAVFGISDSHLVLDTLHVNLQLVTESAEDGSDHNWTLLAGPALNGVAPRLSEDDDDGFDNHYEKLYLPLPYSGGVLLGEGFVRRLYVHMGFHPAWKYETVIELIFEQGVLIGEFDRSARAAEMRELAAMSKRGERLTQEPTDDELRSFIEQAFDRSYGR